MSTGDLKGCMRKLNALLRTIKYPRDVDYNGLSKGDPSACLPLVSFALTSFSPTVTAHLVDSGLEMTAKNDLRFTDTLYKLLRDIFQYKPILSKQQFLQIGFSERKISVICDVINLVLQKHTQLKKSKPRVPSTYVESRVETFPLQKDTYTTLPDRPYVVSHIGDTSPYLGETPSEKSCSELPCCQPDNMQLVVRHTEDDNDNNVAFYCDQSKSVLVEGRLAALEAQLQGLDSGEERLSSLERRLEELESWRTCKDEGETITVSRKIWDNLLSRVHLLETKLELTSTQALIDIVLPRSVRRGDAEISQRHSSTVTAPVCLAHLPSALGHTPRRVVKIREGYLGNQSLECKQATNFQRQSDGPIACSVSGALDSDVSPYPEREHSNERGSSLSSSVLRKLKEDLTGTLERITNMMKNTSSLLKSGEASL